MGIEVAKPLPELFDSDSHPSVLVLQCADGTTRYGVDLPTMRAHSEFCAELIPEDSDDRCLALEQDFADSASVALLATWVDHYRSEPLPPVPVPVPIVHDPSVLYNEWDQQFLGRLICSGRSGEAFSTAGVPQLYRLGRLACFLNVKPLMRLTLSLLAHFITVGVRETGDPTNMIRRWFGLDGDYTTAENEDMMNWMAGVCQGIKLAKRNPAAVPVKAPALAKHQQ
jgi:hypothetical protein